MLTLFLTNESNIALLGKLPPSVRESPQLIAKQVNECKTILAPYFEQLIVCGVDDGSITVQCPKQVAEIFSYLITLWIFPKYLSKDQEEFTNAIDTMSTMLVGIGLPLIDENLRALCISTFKRII